MDIRFGNEQRTVKSAADVDAVLAEAATSQTLLFLAGDSGTLAVGVGHPTHAVLLYNPKAGRPPMHALGDPTADSCEFQPPLTFDGRGFSTVVLFQRAKHGMPHEPSLSRATCCQTPSPGNQNRSSETPADSRLVPSGTRRGRHQRSSPDGERRSWRPEPKCCSRVEAAADEAGANLGSHSEHRPRPSAGGSGKPLSVRTRRTGDRTRGHGARPAAPGNQPLRPSLALHRRRSPRSPRRRARTPRRRARVCPRTGARDAARSRSGSPGTRAGP